MNAQEILARRNEVDLTPSVAPKARLEALAELLDRWADREGRWQRELCRTLPGQSGFDPTTTREGAAAGFGAFSGEALRELARREVGAGDGFGNVSSVLAGAIPMPSLIAIVSPLLAGASLLVKPSAADPLTPRLVLDSLAELCPALAKRAAVVELDSDDRSAIEALMAADCVDLTGSDETVELYAVHASERTRVLRHGHRFSVALVGPDATRGDPLRHFADALAFDISLWDQLGCLSPVALFVCDPDDDAGLRVSEALADALSVAEKSRPRGAVPIGARGRFRDALDTAELRGARVWTPAAHEWSVVLEPGDQLREAPLFRFLSVIACPDAERALTGLRPHQHHLAAAALAGFGDRKTDVAARLKELGASRVCAPGTLQCPPLAWPRDGIPVLAAFFPCQDKSR